MKQEQTYSKEALLGSKRFANDLWVATVALKKNKQYTLDEAAAVIERVKQRRVK